MKADNYLNVEIGDLWRFNDPNDRELHGAFIVLEFTTPGNEDCFVKVFHLVTKQHVFFSFRGPPQLYTLISRVSSDTVE